MMDPVAKFKAGDTVEGYRVLSELGKGAASVIYLVQDPKNKHIWALKHVHRATEKDERFLEQTIAEAEVGQKLDHPNLRQIHRLIKKTTGFFKLTDVYLVMEYLDGPSMEKVRPKSFDEAITIFQQTAAGLRHMHERGYVHADMKPNNIVVIPGPLCKVIDLGQSCKIGTVKPRIQGTPDYIAPEQVHRRAITPQTDIYNLGATMYWTLTNKTVPTALAKADALVSRIDDDLIQRPKPAIEWNPRIPPKLNELVMHCVEINPDNRPATMSYVADRLQLILGMIRARAEIKAPEAHPANSGTGMIDLSSSSGSMKLEEARAASHDTKDLDA